MAYLCFDNVCMVYKGLGGDVEALSSLNLSLEAGEPIAIIGSSGCGKSTTLLLAAGLLKPMSGSITIDGKPVEGPRQETSLILQDFGLLPWKTVEQNAALGLTIRRFSKAQKRERTQAALEQVGLADFAKAYPDELSGGMRQRLALARVVALDSSLLLMDEPLSALDALLREKLQDTLLTLWHDMHYAQVLVTHSIDEAVFLGRRIVLMTPRPGQVAAIVDNPEQGELDYRQSPAFHARCDELRELLHAQGTQAGGGA